MKLLSQIVVHGFVLVQILDQINFLRLKFEDIVLHSLSVILGWDELSCNVLDLLVFLINFDVSLVNFSLCLIQSLIKFSILLLELFNETFSLLDFFILMLGQFDLLWKLILDVGEFRSHHVEFLNLLLESCLFFRLLNKSLILSLLLLLNLVQILLSGVELLRESQHLTLLFSNERLRISEQWFKLMLFFGVHMMLLESTFFCSLTPSSSSLIFILSSLLKTTFDLYSSFMYSFISATCLSDFFIYWMSYSWLDLSLSPNSASFAFSFAKFYFSYVKLWFS